MHLECFTSTCGNILPDNFRRPEIELFSESIRIFIGLCFFRCVLDVECFQKAVDDDDADSGVGDDGTGDDVDDDNNETQIRGKIYCNSYYNFY